MRDVLVLVHDFPPVFAGGVLRPLKFVRYLPAFGWLPRVITTHPDPIRAQDPSLLAQIPPEVEVRRCRFSRRTMPGALLRMLRLPGAAGVVDRYWQGIDRAAPWIPTLLREVEEAVAEKHPDALWITCSPWSLLSAVPRLAASSDLPLILDLRDEWSANPLYRLSGRVLQRAGRLEAAAVRAARRVVVFSPLSTERWRARFPDLPDSHFVTIPNGYDEDDFSGRAPRPREPVTFFFSGTAYQSHDPRAFFQALALVTQRSPELARRVRFLAAGPDPAYLADAARAAGVDDRFEHLGLVPHGDNLGYMMGAQVLVLALSDEPGMQVYSTGKVFEYLRARTPILVMAPEGWAWDLVREYGRGWRVDPHDAEAISEAIANVVTQAPPPPGPKADQIARFERRTLTGALAALLDGVAD